MGESGQIGISPDVVPGIAIHKGLAQNSIKSWRFIHEESDSPVSEHMVPNGHGAREANNFVFQNVGVRQMTQQAQLNDPTDNGLSIAG